MRKFLRWTGLSILGLVLVLVVGVGGFVALGIPIELSGFRGPVEQAASLALGRQVSIDGSVSLAPSLEPTLQIEGVHIANDEGWSDPDLVYLGLARLQLAVLPLMTGRVEVIEIAVDGFQVNLERAADDSVNWLIAPPAKTSEAAESVPESDSQKSGQTTALSMLEIEDLSLDNIVIRYRHAGTGAEYELTFDSIDGSAVDNQPIELKIDGRVQQAPYSIAFEAGSLAAFMRGEAEWPLTLSTTALGANLEIEGKIARPLEGRGLGFAFSLQGDNLEDLEAFVGQDLPPVAGYSFSGTIADNRTSLALTDFEGRVGATAFTGAFSIVLSDDLPAFEGRLDVPAIDLGPLFAAVERGRGGEVADAPGRTGGEFDMEAPVLTLDVLKAFQGRFDMTVGEVTGGPTSIRQSSLQVVVENGVLRSPLDAEIAGVDFSGTFVLDGSSELPEVSAALKASRTDIGDLANALFGLEGIEGGFQGASLELAVKGRSVVDLLRSTDFGFALTDASLSYGNLEGGKPVGFTLDALQLVLPRGEVMQVTADGTVLEETFSMAFVGGDIGQIMRREEWPLELTAEGGGGTFRATGTQTAAKDGQLRLDFELGGPRIGGLSRWLGVSRNAEAAYRIAGTILHERANLTLQDVSAEVGQTNLSATIGLKETDKGPLTTLALSSELLSFDELAGLFPEREPESEPESADQPFSIDIPVLPEGVQLLDADLDLSFAEVRGRDLVLRDLSLTSTIRDGQVRESPFGAAMAGARFDGSVSLDVRGREPSATFAVASEEIDLGDFLDQLGVIENLEAAAGRMSLDLELVGSTARELLQNSSFEARITDGAWTIRDPNLDGALEIGVASGTVTAGPDRKVAMVLEGSIGPEPVTIRMGTLPLGAFAERTGQLPLDLDIALAGATLSLDAIARLPIETRELQFRLDLRGDSLDRFDTLLGASLPPLGPYGLGGDFSIEPDGYRITDFAVAVGESRMEGAFSLATAGERPKLEVALTTRTLQLDDFRFADWSPLGAEEPEASGPVADADDGTALAEKKAKARALLSPEVMRSLDARLDLKVDEVLSGADDLGSGSLLTTLEDGRFEVAPLVVNLPGGSAQVELGYEPDEDVVLAEARARVERLDYGVLARRIDRASEVGGLISVDINLSSQAEDLEAVMARANGYLDFAVWPKDLEAGLFDLWAVNLVTAVLPSVDSENSSKFNCLIARFKVKDGIMTPEAILVDSTRIQASGDGEVDFKQKTVDFTLAPRSKRPQMFSASTPIAVEGSFDDFGVGVAPGGILGTVVRFTTSPIVTPFQWVFSEKVAADGEKACAEAWAREPEELLQQTKETADGQ